MLIISCREGFWNNNHMVADGQDKIADVDLDERNGDFQPVTEKEFGKRVSGKSVLLLVHGYRNFRKAVLSAYNKIDTKQQTIIGHHEIVVGYTWPGGEGLTDYDEARDRVLPISSRFCKLLKLLDGCSDGLDVMSHSLGCRISLESYSMLSGENFPFEKTHSQFLMAAAVNRDSIESGKSYYEGSGYTDGCHVFHSTRDGSLSALTFGSQENSDALGRPGPNKRGKIRENIYGIDCLNIIHGDPHSQYKSTDEVYEHIRKVVKNMEVDRWTDFPTRHDDKK